MTIKLSDFAYFLHALYLIALVLSVFITDYKYLNYVIITLLYIVFIWVAYGCILNDVENFLKCEENNEEACPSAVRKTKLINFHVDIWNLCFVLILVICILRIKYQLNFYTSFYALDISILSITLELIILLLFVIKHYQKYKNIKLFALYTLSLIGALFLSYFYFLR